jgi:hypothetical protein
MIIFGTSNHQQSRMMQNVSFKLHIWFGLLYLLRLIFVKGETHKNMVPITVKIIIDGDLIMIYLPYFDLSEHV